MDMTTAALVAALADGLPLSERPYADLGQRIGLTEDQTIERLHHLIEQGSVRRMGVVVRHHELGYRANAMVVWDIPDQQVAAIGQRLGRCPEVSLCYRRPRRPGWPYNLFTMIHGRDRAAVEAQIVHLRQREAVDGFDHEILFSLRRFKQCGARYGGGG